MEKNRIATELETAELKLKITKLESERNSLIFENTRLKEKLLKYEDSSVNGEKKPVEISDIDTTNLVRARQFLKNTTNEIIFLLNSPSIDNADPLELSKEEPDLLNLITSPKIPQRPQSLDQLRSITPIADLEQFNSKIHDIDTDSETIVEDLENQVFDLSDYVKSVPVPFMKVVDDVVYIKDSSESFLSKIDFNSKESTELKLNPLDVISRLFAIDPVSNTVLEVSNSLTKSYIGVCDQQYKQLYDFELTVAKIDIILGNNVSVLAVLFSNGAVQIFNIDSNGEVVQVERPFKDLPNDTFIIDLKLSNELEITFITKEGRILRYDIESDILVYNLNTGLMLSGQTTISTNFLIHTFDSTSITVIDLLTEKVKNYPVSSSFKINSIDIDREFFTLTYSNGVIELYDLSNFDDSESDDESDELNVETKLPPPTTRIDYYQNFTRPLIIKELNVDLIVKEEDVKVYALGTDFNLKLYKI